jgi:hypothetical protein
MASMEPLFNGVIVGLVPSPTQMPPVPFEREDLQRVFFDVSKDFPYSQFGILPGDQGAQFLNPPEDRVLLQPSLIQVSAPIGTGSHDTTAERAREKAVTVLRTSAERLSLNQFLQCGVKVIAWVPSPEGGAHSYVADHLFRQAEKTQELGEGFVGGGIKLWRFDQANGGQVIELVLIEPLLANDDYIYVEYDIQRHYALDDLDMLGPWIDSAFKFVRERAMTFLEEAS